MKYLISFANEKFANSQKLLEKSAYKYGGIDCVKNFSPKNYDNSSFYTENRDILTMKRGCGYWLWKPWIILETFKQMSDTDYLFYCDSGATIISNVQTLFNLCDNDEKKIILFANSPQHTNIRWTRHSTFKIMDMDTSEFWNAPQVTASFIILKKTPFTMQLIEEWLSICKNPNALIDSTCVSDEYSSFIEHRHDQSILSLLAAKYQINLYRDPSQWGNARKMVKYWKFGEFIEGRFYDLKHIDKHSPYKQLINQQRC